MNNVYVVDESFQKSPLYQNFINENTGSGNLKIRAFMANEAMPVENLKIIVSTLFENEKLIFFEGYTDDSGMIEKLSLPTPVLSIDNLEAPKGISYNIEVMMNDSIFQNYSVELYDGICVLQNIGFSPDWRNS